MVFRSPLIAVVAVLSSIALADEEPETISAPENVRVRGLLQLPTYDFRVLSDRQARDENDLNDNTGKLTYTPAPSLEFGVSVDYSSYSLSFAVPAVKQERNGTKSRYRDIRFESTRNYLTVSGGYQDYSGFSMEEQLPPAKNLKTDTGASVDEPRVTDRADISRETTYVNIFIYPLGGMRDVLDREDGELPVRKWAMGPAIGLGYDQVTLDSAGPFVPKSRQAEFGKDAAFSGGSFTTWSGSLGAAGAFATKHMTYTGLLALSQFVQAQDYAAEDGHQSRHVPGKRANARFAVDGFFGHWTGGFFLHIDMYQIPLRGLEISATTALLGISCGRYI